VGFRFYRMVPVQSMVKVVGCRPGVGRPVVSHHPSPSAAATSQPRYNTQKKANDELRVLSRVNGVQRKAVPREGQGGAGRPTDVVWAWYMVRVQFRIIARSFAVCAWLVLLLRRQAAAAGGTVVTVDPAGSAFMSCFYCRAPGIRDLPTTTPPALEGRVDGPRKAADRRYAAAVGSAGRPTGLSHATGSVRPSPLPNQVSSSSSSVRVRSSVRLSQMNTAKTINQKGGPAHGPRPNRMGCSNLRAAEERCGRTELRHSARGACDATRGFLVSIERNQTHEDGRCRLRQPSITSQ
jgi:hypothetical protein